ncbi:MAG: hypothetical protein GEU88_10825 [Solirubrobacterales bacterium]|nr:hypothetical protein [Solirubrobacterales bacterium]
MLGYRRDAVDDALAMRDEELAARDRSLAARDQALTACAGALAHGREDLERRERRITELDLVCDSLCARIVERECELERARVDLRRALAGEASVSPALVELERELDALPGGAREQRAVADAGEPGPAPTSSDGAGAEIPDALFDGLVEVEVGPLADFSQLVGFEDAAGGITATSQISVKRFTQGRATLEVRLAEPVELLRELEERSPFEFRVRDQRTGRVVLDVDDE